MNRDKLISCSCNTFTNCNSIWQCDILYGAKIILLMQILISVKKNKTHFKMRFWSKKIIQWTVYNELYTMNCNFHALTNHWKVHFMYTVNMKYFLNLYCTNNDFLKYKLLKLPVSQLVKEYNRRLHLLHLTTFLWH